MAVDDVEELTDGIDGKLVHAVQGDTTVAARECVECADAGADADDEGAAVRFKALGYGDIADFLFIRCAECRYARVVGDPCEEYIGIALIKFAH